MNVCVLGVNGIGMSAISKFLSFKGFTVYGIDSNMDNINLEQNKSPTFNQYKINFVYKNDNHYQYIENADIVIYSSAIDSENSLLKYAFSLKKAVYSRAEILGEIIKIFYNSIGVAGSHGKTTTTSMLSHVLYVNKISFTSFIGGEDILFNNCHLDNLRENFITEICEFKRNIRFQSPKIALLLNVDNDHLDCYENIENLIGEFERFLNRSDYSFINADDNNLKSVKPLSNLITFGIKNNADYMANNIKSESGKYSFNVVYRKKDLGNIKLNVYGKHNVYNAIGVVAVCKEIFKLNIDEINKGLNSFKGVKRRFESLGEFYSNNIIADYCHHPTEIESTFLLSDELFKDYIVIFEPHTYSRTRILFDDFVKVLKNKNLIIYKTFPAREKFDSLGSAKRLSESLKGSKYFEDFNELFLYVKNLKNKNILVLGAGELYDKFKKEIKS